MRQNVIEKAKDIRKLWSAYWTARPLITGANLEIFEHLKTKKTAPAAAKKIKADPRATEILLDALSGLGYVKKWGKSYRNTKEANLFLVKSSPYYQGDIIRHADNLWNAWGRLDEVVLTGKPVLRDNKAAFNLEAFILGMHNLAVFKARSVINAIGMKHVKKAADIGGGPGTYAMEMRKQGVERVTLFDLPDTVEIAKRHIKKLGVKGIDFLAGDFLKDSLGKGYDLVFMSNIHHANNTEGASLLTKKAYEALNTGGRAVIHEFYMKENRTEPLPGALFSINMLVNTPGGRCYTEKELKGFLKQAGFKKIKSKILGDTVLVEGTRRK